MDIQKFDIVIGSDHGGFELKEAIKEFLLKKNYIVDDVGTYDTGSCDYPVYAKKVAESVVTGRAERGILVCGTGQGMAMCANKFKGIRAVVCSDTFSAHASQEHNNSNILCLGQRVVGVNLALDIVQTWLSAEYEGGRHQKRIYMFD